MKRRQQAFETVPRDHRDHYGLAFTARGIRPGGKLPLQHECYFYAVTFWPSIGALVEVVGRLEMANIQRTTFGHVMIGYVSPPCAGGALAHAAADRPCDFAGLHFICSDPTIGDWRYRTSVARETSSEQAAIDETVAFFASLQYMLTITSEDSWVPIGYFDGVEDFGWKTIHGTSRVVGCTSIDCIGIYGDYLVRRRDIMCPQIGIYDPITQTTRPRIINNGDYWPFGFNCARLASQTQSYSITLSGLGLVEPEATLTGLTAKVTDSVGQPVAGATVHLKVEALPDSGGHKHGDNNDPKRRGKLSGISPEIVATNPTGSDGTFSFTFNAPAAAGTYKITARCDDRTCTQQGNDTFDVKVSGLVPLDGQQSTFNFELVGSTSSHPNNHYLRPDAQLVAWKLAEQYHATFPNDPVLRFNDASLEWGGAFDICAGQETSSGCVSAQTPCVLQANGYYSCTWSSPHIEHRRGSVVDVRANNDRATAIPRRNDVAFQKLARRLGTNPGNPHSPNSITNRHWHVQLLGVAE